MAPTSLVVSGLLLLTLLPSLVPAQTVTRKENYLIVANWPNVSALNMRGEVQHEFDETYSYGVDFDPTNARIFWTNRNRGSIETAFLNGSLRTVLRQVAGTRPIGLAVDHILQLVFYSDVRNKRIEVMDTDGGSHRIVRDQGSAYFRSLAVDVIQEVLYYTEEVYAGEIGRMNYNGSGHEVLINSISGALGLALDVRGGRMYWTNYFGERIESARLDGTDRTLVLRNLSGPIALALFDGVLYYSVNSVSSIYSVTVNGPDRQELTTTVSGKIEDIAVYSESQAITLEEKLAALGIPECESGMFGDSCGSICQKTCANSSCHHVTGHCALGCVEGWEGDFCTKQTLPIVDVGLAFNTGLGLGVGMGTLLLVVLALLAAFCYWRRLQERSMGKTGEAHQLEESHVYERVDEEIGGAVQPALPHPDASAKEENVYEKVEESEDLPRVAVPPGNGSSQYEGLNSATANPSAPYEQLRGTKTTGVASPGVYENRRDVTAGDAGTSSDYVNRSYQNLDS